METFGVKDKADVRWESTSMRIRMCRLDIRERVKAERRTWLISDRTTAFYQGCAITTNPRKVGGIELYTKGQ